MAHIFPQYVFEPIKKVIHIDLEKDYFQLTRDEISTLRQVAKDLGYRHKYNPSCCVSKANQTAYYLYLKLQIANELYK